MTRAAVAGIAFVTLAVTGNGVVAQGAHLSLKEIRERGVVMQQWETSCAAAAISTVLTYGFGEGVAERDVATSMLDRAGAVTIKAQQGFSLFDMKGFVESRGYRGVAYRDLTLRDLQAFHAPIVPITRHGLNHYVVVNAVAGDSVRIADPAFGNRTLRTDQFAAMWLDGIAFVIAPK